MSQRVSCPLRCLFFRFLVLQFGILFEAFETVFQEDCSASLHQAKMAALAAAELDEDEEKAFFSVPGATVISAKPPHSLETTWPLHAIIQFWPLGLVLAAAPVTVTGLRQDLSLLACLRVLQESDCYKVESCSFGCGITSVRALPQVTNLRARVSSTVKLLWVQEPELRYRAEQPWSQLSSYSLSFSTGLDMQGWLGHQ